MLALVAVMLAGSTPIDECRDAWKALDVERTIAVCSLAGAATDGSVGERVDAFRILGAAFVLQDRVDLAEGAFRQMLALDPHATLGDDAGPKAQAALARVAASLAHVEPKPASVAPTPPLSPTPTPSTSERALWPALTAGGVAVGSACAVVAGLGIQFEVHGASGFRDADNLTFWRIKSADTLSLLPNSSDPTGSHWGAPYGPQLAPGPSEPAHFAMTAVAVEQKSTLETLDTVSIVLIASSGVTAVASGVVAIALWHE